MSLRKIARTMNSHYGLRLGDATIYRWIRKVVPKVSEYVNGLAPELSDTWHADELFVKTKGGSKFMVQGKTEITLGYLWNIMDRRTRFLLASKPSKFRDVAGADRAFREAFKNAGESRPEKVVTDGLNSYKTAFSGFPVDSRPELIAKAGIRKPHANNNRIEWLNGTLRERVKVQRVG